MLEFLTVPEAFSRNQALRAVGLLEKQVKQWERSGCIERLETYALPDIVALRTLARLKKAKVSPKKIAEVLANLKLRWQESDNPLAGLKLTVDGRHVIVWLGPIQMDAGSGQMLLDFADAQASGLIELPAARVNAREIARKRREAEDWFQRGVELEQSGAPSEQALDAYLVALKLDATLTAAMVNIGTIHFAARQLNDAEKYYRMAVETNPAYALAHFNLGNLHDERGFADDAIKHYERALELEPRYADAHYNAALIYQGQSDVMRAISHWRTYLELDPQGYWSDLARRELAKLYEATVVEGTGPKSRQASSGW